MADPLTSNDFADLPDGSLAIEHQGAMLAVHVVELRDLPPTPSRAAPFSMVLQGPAAPLLAQGIHKLVHPSLGALELFLVPISRAREHARYELVFN